MAESGELRGATKEETWQQFQTKKKNYRRLDLETDFPVNKEDAFKRMQRDDQTQTYVLKYHFGK